MIRREWQRPWQQVEIIKEIQELMLITHSSIKHVFREANKLADMLANEVYEHETLIEIQSSNQLSVESKQILNIDKAQLPTLRIKTRRIRVKGY